MPLIKGKSKEAFSKNVSTEMHAGKTQKQSLAIAYAMKRKAKKMAHGGRIQDEEYESGYEPMPKNHEIHNSAAIHEDDLDLNQHGRTDHFDSSDIVDRVIKKRMMMAEGGEIHHADIHHKGAVVADEGEDELSHMADGKENDFDYLSTGDHELDDSTTNSGAADGDFLGNSQEDEDRKDIVKRIMRQRSMKQHNPRPA